MSLKKSLKWIGLGLTLLVACAAGWLYAYGDELNKAEFWEREIQAFEAADAERFPDANLILFTGSSSIRLWETLAEDMAPLGILNRGFGGAHMDHVLHYYDQVIKPYRPRALVLYVGDNDIGAGKTPETVERDFRALVDRVRVDQPDLPIYFLTIKASRLRWKSWPQIQEANQRIQNLAEIDPLLHLIDVTGPMVEASDGEKPPSSLFAFDGLHLSEAGYALWTGIVRERLIRDFGPR